MFISVIITTYNRKEKVCFSIDSVLKQTYKNFEILVVDDGSTDGTFDYLKQFFQKKIHLFYQENKGVSAARNLGIKQSKGDWIAFLDSDDVWFKTKLEEQVHHLKKTHYKISQTNEIWIKNNIRVNPSKRNIKKEGNIFQESLKLCLITISSVIISRVLLEKNGLFDEDLLVCEDYDLWIKITNSTPVGLLKKNLLIRYGGHKDQLSKKYLVIDRFRLYSLLNFYVYYHNSLNFEKKSLVKNEIFFKWNFIKKGREKRNLDCKELNTSIHSIINCDFYQRVKSLKKLKILFTQEFHIL